MLCIRYTIIMYKQYVSLSVQNIQRIDILYTLTSHKEIARYEYTHLKFCRYIYIY